LLFDSRTMWTLILSYMNNLTSEQGVLVIKMFYQNRSFQLYKPKENWFFWSKSNI